MITSEIGQQVSADFAIWIFRQRLRGTPRRNMQKARANKIIGYLVAGIVASLCTGCLVPSQQAIRTGDARQESSTQLESGPSMQPQGLIKPTIPEDRRQQGSPDSEPQHLPPADPESGAQPAAIEQPEAATPPQPSRGVQEEPESIPPQPRPQPLPPSSETPQDAPRSIPQSWGGQSNEARDWEDQKIKAAAIDLAKGFPHVTKIKVCYAVREDEWWVTLYDNAGAFTELKQYTWNRDLEKLEVFLVLKRIPSSRVQQQLSEQEPGKACEIIDHLKTGLTR